MKFSSAFLGLIALAPASAMTIRNPKAAAKVLSKSRRLDQGGYNQYQQYQGNGQYQQQGQYNQYNGNYNNDQQQQQQQQQQGQYNQYNGNYNNDQQQQEGQNAQYNGYYSYGDFDDSDYPFLSTYSLKLIGCFSGVSSYTQDGDYSSATVAYRLCPNNMNGGCDSSYQYGCDEGFGDYLVSIDVFTQAFYELEEMKQIEWNENFDVSEYIECSEYKGDNDNDNDDTIYIGPTCASDGVNIALGVFQDENCAYASSTAFQYISNGYSLPFASGGLVNPYCVNCITTDDDDDAPEYEISEFCAGAYEEASSACETNMGHYSENGLNTYGCSDVNELTGFYNEATGKATTSKKKANRKAQHFGRKIFVVFFLFGLIGGTAYYVMWWRKQKAEKSEITANTEGTLA